MDRLDCIPRLDKSVSIKAFVQSQKFYAIAHAVEGEAELHSWQTEARSVLPDKHVIPNRQDTTPYGFGTPILKARKTPVASTQSHHDVENLLTASETKKRAIVADSWKLERKDSPSKDQEQVERLAERRERKRVKRAILRSPQEQERRNGKKDRADKRRKETKVPVGLALMHGFSATNVGNVRLTVRSAPKLGVFKKGKASAKTQVSRQPAAKSATTLAPFSEDRFLNMPTRSKATESPQSPPSAQTDCRRGSSPPSPTIGGSRPVMNSRNSDLDSQASSAGQHDAVASEIWDIEKDEFILPSRIGSDRTPPQTKEDQPSTPQITASGSPICASPPLHPSDSASQCHVSRDVTSKYFATLPNMPHNETRMAPGSKLEATSFCGAVQASEVSYLRIPDLLIGDNTHLIPFENDSNAYRDHHTQTFPDSSTDTAETFLGGPPLRAEDVAMDDECSSIEDQAGTWTAHIGHSYFDDSCNDTHPDEMAICVHTPSFQNHFFPSSSGLEPLVSSLELSFDARESEWQDMDSDDMEFARIPDLTSIADSQGAGIWNNLSFRGLGSPEIWADPYSLDAGGQNDCPDVTDVDDYTCEDWLLNGIDPDDDLHHESLSVGNFTQGRELLYFGGDRGPNVLAYRQVKGVREAEADVAKTMTSHWFPQKLA